MTVGSSHRSLLTRLRGRDFENWVQLVTSIWPRLKSRFYYPLIFGSFGKGSILYKPLLIQGAKHIHIGTGVTIRQGIRLQAVLLDPALPPEIRVGNNVNLEQHLQIVALGSIHIHDNAAVGGTSALLCGEHPFTDVSDPTPIPLRNAGTGTFIEIGSGSLVGYGSVVHMNVRVGRHAVIQSNAVVRSDVPDYSVSGGNPAHVVLEYSPEKDDWVVPKSFPHASAT